MKFFSTRISQIIRSERKKFVQQHNFSKYSDINVRDCATFANIIIDKVEGAVLADDGNWWKLSGLPRTDMLQGHWWIYYQGKHYDAECPLGVDHPRELPFFNQYGKGKTKIF